MIFVDAERVTKRTYDGHVGDPLSFRDCAACWAGTVWPAGHTISDAGAARTPLLVNNLLTFCNYGRPNVQSATDTFPSRFPP
jgi:hypothetical protein